jgi:hypothetical protein
MRIYAALIDNVFISILKRLVQSIRSFLISNPQLLVGLSSEVYFLNFEGTKKFILIKN